MFSQFQMFSNHLHGCDFVARNIKHHILYANKFEDFSVYNEIFILFISFYFITSLNRLQKNKSVS